MNGTISKQSRAPLILKDLQDGKASLTQLLKQYDVSARLFGVWRKKDPELDSAVREAIANNPFCKGGDNYIGHNPEGNGGTLPGEVRNPWGGNRFHTADEMRQITMRNMRRKEELLDAHMRAGLALTTEENVNYLGKLMRAARMKGPEGYKLFLQAYDRLCETHKNISTMLTKESIILGKFDHTVEHSIQKFSSKSEEELMREVDEMRAKALAYDKAEEQRKQLKAHAVEVEFTEIANDTVAR